MDAQGVGARHAEYVAIDIGVVREHARHGSHVEYVILSRSVGISNSDRWRIGCGIDRERHGCRALACTVARGVSEAVGASEAMGRGIGEAAVGVDKDRAALRAGGVERTDDEG